MVIADAELGPVGDIIGYCGFVNPSVGEAKIEFDEHAALEVGWGIHPAYQRRGLASEAMKPVLDFAFGQYGCVRLIAITDPENYASQTLSLRLGFEFSSVINAYGTLQEHYVLEPDNFLAPPPKTESMMRQPVGPSASIGRKRVL